MKRVPMLLLLMPLACDSPTIPPRSTQDIYDFRLPTSPPSVMRWPTGTTVRVFIEQGTVEQRADTMIAAFELAATRWNDAARYREYNIERAADIAQADVLLRWSDEISAVDFEGCEPELSTAVTTFCLDDDAPSRLRTFPFIDSPQQSRVRIVVTVLGTEAGRPGRVERLVAHELGHVLGLTRHSLDSNDLMFAGTPTRSTLSRRDSATVQVLYHTRAAITP